MSYQYGGAGWWRRGGEGRRRVAQGVARVCMGAMGTFGCSAAGTARLSDQLLYRLPFSYPISYPMAKQLPIQLSYQASLAKQLSDEPEWRGRNLELIPWCSPVVRRSQVF